MLYDSFDKSLIQILISTFYRLSDLAKVTNLVVYLRLKLRLSNPRSYFLKNYMPVSVKDQGSLELNNTVLFQVKGQKSVLANISQLVTHSQTDLVIDTLKPIFSFHIQYLIFLRFVTIQTVLHPPPPSSFCDLIFSDGCFEVIFYFEKITQI